MYDGSHPLRWVGVRAPLRSHRQVIMSGCASPNAPNTAVTGLLRPLTRAAPSRSGLRHRRSPHRSYWQLGWVDGQYGLAAPRTRKLPVTRDRSCDAPNESRMRLPWPLSVDEFLLCASEQKGALRELRTTVPQYLRTFRRDVPGRTTCFPARRLACEAHPRSLKSRNDHVASTDEAENRKIQLRRWGRAARDHDPLWPRTPLLWLLLDNEQFRRAQGLAI